MKKILAVLSVITLLMLPFASFADCEYYEDIVKSWDDSLDAYEAEEISESQFTENIRTLTNETIREVETLYSMEWMTYYGNILGYNANKLNEAIDLANIKNVLRYSYNIREAWVDLIEECFNEADENYVEEAVEEPKESN